MFSFKTHLVYTSIFTSKSFLTHSLVESYIVEKTIDHDNYVITVTVSQSQ